MSVKPLITCTLVIVTLFLTNNCSPDSPIDPPEEDSLSTGWQRIPISDVVGLTDIWFVNQQTGFLAGVDYLAKSTDGGLTWKKIGIPAGLGRLDHLFFVDANIGWVLAGSQSMLRTTDGGTTWATVQLPSPNFRNIQFLNPRLGYATEYFNLYQTIDSGKTWQKRSPTMNTLTDLFFLDSLNGWVTTLDKIAKTSNAGSSFTTQQIINFYHVANPLRPKFIGANYGWVFSSDTLWRTSNGGTQWQPYRDTTLFLNNDYSFFDAQNGYILDHKRILITSDGGLHRSQVVNAKAGGVMTALYFTDDRHGWAVNDANVIYRYVK